MKRHIDRHVDEALGGVDRHIDEVPSRQAYTWSSEGIGTGINL